MLNRTNQQIDVRQELIEREIAKIAPRMSFLAFVARMRPDYEFGWFNKQVCEVLQEFYEAYEKEETPRVMLNSPPRSGKSELSSRLFPAWVLGKNPDANIVLCSYSGELATTFAKDVMRIMESETYKEIFPDSRLQGSKRSEDGVNYARQTNFFEVVKKKGSFYAVGTGGSLTGRNCSILILDDLVKDSASADSQTIRDNTWEWLTTTAWTRLFKKNGVLCLMTRWHLDDVASRLLATQDKEHPWRHVNFKAIADEDEKFRKAGEALHPQRFPLNTLLRIKRQIGERAWLSLYQQSPVPDGGALFKSNWICYYTDAEKPFEFEKEIVSLDCSFDGKAVNDFSVMTHWGVKKGRYYLLDCLRGHWDYVELRRRFKLFCQQFPKAVTKLIEKKANGDAIIADLKSEGVIGLTPIVPKDSKVSRANSVTPLFESSSVFFPDRKTHSWVDECVVELCSFPQAKHDDFVDSCTQALNYFMSKHSRAIDPSVKRMLVRPR